VNEMFLKSGVAPNCLVTDCALRMGGICFQDIWEWVGAQGLRD